MQKAQALWNTRNGKIGIGVGSLTFVCVCCFIIFAALSPSQPSAPALSQEQIQQTALAVAWSSFTQTAADLREEIKDLEKKKKRWLDLYETEKLDASTLTERLRTVQKQLDEANAKLAKQRASQTRRESSRNTRARLAQLVDHLEGYYLQAPQAQVNADLHDIIEQIVLSKDLQVKIKWRGEE